MLAIQEWYLGLSPAGPGSRLGATGRWQLRWDATGCRHAWQPVLAASAANMCLQPPEDNIEHRRNSPPDDQGVALRNADGVLVDEVVELGGHTPEIKVCQRLPQGVRPDLLQGGHDGGDVCARCQEALQQGQGQVSVTLLRVSGRPQVHQRSKVAWASALYG